jgi:beta-galactosidase
MTLAHFEHLDYAQWAPEQDVVSTDHYVVDTLEDPQAELSFCGDLTRGLAGGRPWLLMEHSTSAVNWQPVNPAKAPGEMTRNSLVHVAHGADTLGFFQFRQSRAGAEKFHSALVPHAGRDSARFREVAALGALVERLGEVVGSTVVADVAILFDYQSNWAAKGPAMPSSAVDPGAVARSIHRVLRAKGVTADVVHPATDLTRYRVVVVPALYSVTDANARAIAAAASAGAQVVVTFFSGISDEHDHVRLGGYPGAFRDLLGVRSEEFFPLRAGETVALAQGTGSLWSEDLTTQGAEVVTTYAAGPLAGKAAVTRADAGAGAAWYLATMPDDEVMEGLLDRVLADAGVRPAAMVPAGVEAVRRRGAEGSWLFLVNHTDAAAQVPATGTDLVTGDRVDGRVSLPAGGVAVVREA